MPKSVIFLNFARPLAISIMTRVALYSFLGLVIGFGSIANGQELDFTQRGTASYYADDLHGRPTASGEKYDRDKFTAAHLTLPLGTQVKVTNLRTGRSVIVTVNDRGPFTQRFCIDLSKVAAKSIGVIGDVENDVFLQTLITQKSGFVQGPGTIEIPSLARGFDSLWFHANMYERGKIYDLEGNQALPRGLGWQLSTFEDVINAKKIGRQLKAANLPSPVFLVPDIQPDGRKVFKIIVGEHKNPKEAESTRRYLAKLGIPNPVLRPYP